MSGWSTDPAMRRSSVAPKKLSACSGWRRSWLAEARNWLFSRLAWAVSSICWCSRSTSAAFSSCARKVLLSRWFCASARRRWTAIQVIGDQRQQK